eukprot:gene2915-biopygen2880
MCLGGCCAWGAYVTNLTVGSSCPVFDHADVPEVHCEGTRPRDGTVTCPATGPLRDGPTDGSVPQLPSADGSWSSRADTADDPPRQFPSTSLCVVTSEVPRRPLTSAALCMVIGGAPSTTCADPARVWAAVAPNSIAAAAVPAVPPPPSALG